MQSIVEPALQTLMKLQLLQALLPDVLRGSKAVLSTHCGLAERTLVRHIEWLREQGMLAQERSPGVFAASVLSVTEKGSAVLLRRIRTRRTEEIQSHGAPSRAPSAQSGAPRDWPEIVTSSAENPPLLSPSCISPPINTPEKPRSARLTSNDVSKKRERADFQKAAAPPAQLATRVTLPAKAPVFPVMGTVSMVQLRLNAKNGTVSRKDRAFLRTLRRNVYRPWWDAYKRGLAERFRDEYLTRWCNETGKTRAAWQYNPTLAKNEHSDTLWDKVALNVIDLGCTVEFYMDVAVDTRPRNLKFPTLNMIASPKFKMTVQNWSEKQERQTELMVDGQSWEDLMERSKEMGVT